MFKNFTLSQITILLALVIALVNVVILLILYLVGDLSISAFAKLTFILILGTLTTFIIVRTLLGLFVFGKIKVIYRMIDASRHRKLPRTEKTIEKRTLGEVDEEVMSWAQSQEQEMDYLRKLEQYRKSFLGNISHELKTPLFAIQGYLLTLLEGGLYDESINTKYLKRAANNVDRLKNIVDDLDIINQLELGKINLTIDSFNIRELCEEVFDDLRFLSEESGISLSFSDSASKRFIVNADRDKIRQVLYNLIVNAIKYGKKNGSVKISFSRIDESVRIDIADDGIGIAEEHINHLFDRFYRVEQSRSRKKGGSGLGLSIVKHILEAHGQVVTVESEVNEGSTFSFLLPKG